jgi:hypothetical protein
LPNRKLFPKKLFPKNTEMLKNILTYRDYREIVDNCKNCLGGLGIRDFITDIFKVFGSSNTNLELSLMEYLELNYQPIEGIEGLIDRKYDILNFKDEVPEIENASIEYLYMLLNSMIENPKTEISKSQSVKMDFRSKYSNEQIKNILERFKKEKVCDFSDVSTIMWIFTDKEPNSKSEKIKWTYIPPKLTVPFNRGIYYFMSEVFENDMDFFKRNTLYNEVNKRFIKPDNTQFTIDSLRQTYNRFKEDLEINLDEPNNYSTIKKIIKL